MTDIKQGEVLKIVRGLKRKKSGGPDDLVPEYFKSLVHTTEGLQLLTDLCNLCFQCKTTPENWKVSRVALLFKKGELIDTKVGLLPKSDLVEWLGSKV